MSLFHRKPQVPLIGGKGCVHTYHCGTCPSCQQAKLAHDRAMLDAVTKKR